MGNMILRQCRFASSVDTFVYSADQQYHAKYYLLTRLSCNYNIKPTLFPLSVLCGYPHPHPINNAKLVITLTNTHLTLGANYVLINEGDSHSPVRI